MQPLRAGSDRMLLEERGLQIVVVTVGVKKKFTYCSCSTTVIQLCMVRLKTMPDLHLVNCNYATNYDSTVEC